jgi:hypothetical protein
MVLVVVVVVVVVVVLVVVVVVVAPVVPVLAMVPVVVLVVVVVVVVVAMVLPQPGCKSGASSGNTRGTLCPLASANQSLTHVRVPSVRASSRPLAGGSGT